MPDNKPLLPDEELQSILIIPQKRIFQMNGKDFGKGCKKFTVSISKNGTDDFKITLEIDLMKTYINYDGRSGKRNAGKNT